MYDKSVNDEATLHYYDFLQLALRSMERSNGGKWNDNEAVLIGGLR